MNSFRGGIQQGEVFFEAQGDSSPTGEAQNVTLFVRGLVRWNETPLADVAGKILDHYRQTGSLPAERLEGSFTLTLLDRHKGKIILYRNLVGNGFTYYTQTSQGFLFGSNLAELVQMCDRSPKPNPKALPAFFLFRFVPGRQTLFQDCYRLLPGEELTFDGQVICRRQRQTFADLRQNDSESIDSVDRVEQTMAAVLADQKARRPDTVNLLSGGVDSTYLQAIWNRVSAGPARSFSVSVDHPQTRPESAYAMSAASALRTAHTLVPANEPYMEYLVEALATTGEPPNHVMSVYFGKLARAMQEAGAGNALCGEGADSLFGVGAAEGLQNALWLRKLVPGRLLRRWGSNLASLAGRKHLAAAFRLADHVDDEGHWEHPLNRVAVFTEWELVRAAFGENGIDAALAERRELLDLAQAGHRPLDRLHAVGYLGEAVDSASLWTTLFNQAGGDLYCPYLDSRILRLALNLPDNARFAYRQPKKLLKQALARHVPREIIERVKLGFGQPIFEWLSPGGQLRPRVERIGDYDFLSPAVRASALARPGWFLYSLLCYDLWHKLFIDRTLDPTSLEPSAARSGALELSLRGLGMVLS